MSVAPKRRGKKKKGRPKRVVVNTSKPHRRRGGWVSGYFRGRTKKAHRNKRHTRNKRRTKEQIKMKGTRKEERKKKSTSGRLQTLSSLKRSGQKKGKKIKTKQTTFAEPRGPPKVKQVKPKLG